MPVLTIRRGTSGRPPVRLDAVILIPVACLLVAAMFILRSRRALAPWDDRLRLAGTALLGIGVALIALRISMQITG